MLRFGRIDAGLPAVFLADEEINMKNALSMAARRTLRPLYFNYPTLTFYLLAGLCAGLYLVGRVFGLFTSPADFGVRFFADPTPMYLVARAASAFWSIGAMLVVYLAGRRFYGTRAALLGALLLGLGIESAREAALVTPNAALAFLAILAFLPIHAVATRGRLRDYLLAGVAIGLSVSAKYNSGLLIFPLALAHFGGQGERRPLRNLLFGGLATLLAFVATSPYWVLAFPEYLDSFRFESSHMRTGHIGEMGKTPVLWAILAIVKEERTAGLLAIAGVILAAARRTREDLLLLAFVVPSFLSVSLLRNQQLDYLAFLWPPAALLGGRALDALLAWRPLARAPGLAVTAGALLIAPSAAGALAEFRAARAPDTRHAARAWIEANIPSGAGISYDRYHYVAPLLDGERARKSEMGRRYMDAEFLDSIERALRGRPTYRLVSLVVPSKALHFPPEVDSLPDAAAFRARAAHNPFLRGAIFGTRNRTLDELRAEGAGYLLLSSKWTDRILIEPPPPKDNPLYFYWVRERRDIEEILHDPGVEEVRRWEPGDGVVGPRVTLYRIAAAERGQP